MPRHIALMRGINVGGRNKLPMSDLALIFEKAGCEDVRTYIQSGNVVFSAPAAVARAVPARVEQEVQRAFGIRSPVVTRSAKELEAVIDNVPFETADGNSLHVAFLARKPNPAAARRLDPDRSPGDAFQLIGRDIYLSFPNGVARTRLTNDYFDRTLDTVSTVRNWRTVLKLADLIQ